jgi:acetyl-CoA synthetase
MTGDNAYTAHYRNFAWAIPRVYNMGVDVCDRWAIASPDRTAIIEIDADDQPHPFSYGALRAESNRIARALRKRGIGRGDIVALLLPQSRHVAAAHIAIYKLGAITLPLASLFGVDALAYRLADSQARGLICDAPGLAKIDEIGRAELPDLQTVLCLDGAAAGADDFFAALAVEP